MATLSKFSCFVADLAKKVHNISTDVIGIALSNTSPTATDTVFAVGTLHPAPAAANGYNTGGATCTVSSFSYSSAGTLTVWAPDTVFTASAGGIGPFQWVIMYNRTAAGLNLIGYYNYGSSITLAVGETFTVDFDNAAGWWTLA